MADFSCDSDDFYLETLSDHKQTFANWFNEQYTQCKKYIMRDAKEQNIAPEELSYDVRMMQDKWDLKFLVTAVTKLQKED